MLGKEGPETGATSPGGLSRHTTGGTANHQEGGFRDMLITGTEPRVWPGAISSSMKRQSSFTEMDGASRSNEQQSRSNEQSRLNEQCLSDEQH
jgi:hypothetical protein